MSVCHIWLGVARSKKRGRVILRCLRGGRSVINSASCSRCRTVSGLAGKKKHRRNTWLMRLMPNVGFSCLSSMILSVIGVGSRCFRGPDLLGSNPASPLDRYASSHNPRQDRLTPTSSQTIVMLKPSSR